MMTVGSELSVDMECSRKMVGLSKRHSETEMYNGQSGESQVSGQWQFVVVTILNLTWSLPYCGGAGQLLVAPGSCLSAY